MEKNTEKFDIVVVGGGPAGMMAAGRAAELGARVALVEKNKNPGRKLLITGKGRCNITQTGFDGKKLIEKFGRKGKFLFSSLAAFGPEDVVNFFESKKLKTKTERGGRVFPVTDKAQDVLTTLKAYLRNNKVRIFSGVEAQGLETKNGKIKSVKVKKLLSGERSRNIFADKFILCSGGKSYPLTGSTGDGYGWAKDMGHTIIDPVPALVPVKIKELWVKNLQGLSLKNVELSLYQKGKKQESRFGEMLFTHFGLSGPIVLDISKRVGELLTLGETIISIDLKPALDFSALDKRLQRDFGENNNKDFKNYLPELLPQKLIDIVVTLSGIEADRKINFITREERKKLVKLLKNMRLTVEGTMGYNQAIVTSGGVDLKEVDSKTMQSRIIKNLFFAGEILDLDGPTGGYNLQICWSTGYAAGTYAAGEK